MTNTPAFFSPWLPDDERGIPPLVGTERELLTAYLDWHRRTLELKCAGLTAEQLSERAISPSALSLHGLVRHLAGVERWWFRIQFGREDVPLLFYSDEEPNQDFDDLDGSYDDVLALWKAECDLSRAIVDATPSLDATGVHGATGNPVSLRRVMIGTIAEYARHNGHADLLRERLDGATGL